MRWMILLAALAFAKPKAPVPAQGSHANGAVVESEHPAEAHAEEHAGEHHVTVTGDDDHDGTANWLDSDSEAYQTGSQYPQVKRGAMPPRIDRLSGGISHKNKGMLSAVILEQRVCCR